MATHDATTYAWPGPLPGYSPNGNWLKRFANEPSSLVIAADYWRVIAAEGQVQVADGFKPTIPKQFDLLTRLLASWCSSAAIDAAPLSEFSAALRARTLRTSDGSNSFHWLSAGKMERTLAKALLIIYRIDDAGRLAMKEQAALSPKDARNKFAYERYMAGDTYKQIRLGIAKHPEWEQFSSDAAVRGAIAAWAKIIGVDIPKRQAGRRPSAK